MCSGGDASCYQLQALSPRGEAASGPSTEAVLGPSADAAQAACPVTIDYEAKLLQGTANASAALFVGSVNIQNDSPSVRICCHPRLHPE